MGLARWREEGVDSTDDRRGRDALHRGTFHAWVESGERSVGLRGGKDEGALVAGPPVEGIRGTKKRELRNAGGGGEMLAG